VVALLYADRRGCRAAAERLTGVFGPFDYASVEFPHDQSEYYRPETGWPLYKRFLSAENLIDPGRLPDMKANCLYVEAEFSVNGQRQVNIDPGYIAAEKLVLATGKPSANRIYLDQGVWADLTLIYQHGGFQPLAWTYPDYRQTEVLAALIDIRRKYLDQLKQKEKEDQ
jgi:hypothetical protein